MQPPAVRFELKRCRSQESLYLSDQEFALLHELLDTPPDADLTLDVEGMTPQDQAAALRAAWQNA